MNDEIKKELRSEQIKILDEIVRICKEENIKYFLDYGTLLGAVRHKGYIPWDDDIDIGMLRKDYNKFIRVATKKLKEDFILCYYKNEPHHFHTFAKVRLKNTIMLESLYQHLDINNGIWVDIFPYDNLNKPNSTFIRIRKKIFDVITTFISIKLDIDYYKNTAKKIKLKKVLKFIPLKLLYSIREFACKINFNNSSKYVTCLDEEVVKCCKGRIRNKVFPYKELLFEGKKYLVCNDYDYVLKNEYGDYMKIPKKSEQKTHNPLLLKFESGEVVDFRKEKEYDSKDTI